MNRNAFVSIVCFYALILALGFSRPVLQKLWAEHRKELEGELQRIMTADDPIVPTLQVAVQKRKPRILTESGLGRAMFRHGSNPKRLANGKSLIVHAKAPAGMTPNNRPKTNGAENNGVS